MKLLFAASEAAPFVKSGGLGDVMGSLPPALATPECNVSCIVPLYDAVNDETRAKMTFLGNIFVPVAWRSQYCGVFLIEERGVNWYFVDNEYYFRRGSLYGTYDDGERFAFFSRAVLEVAKAFDIAPDIIHCNDWQTALIPVYLKTLYKNDEVLWNTKCVFTIHNIEYQGVFGREILENVFGLPNELYDSGMMKNEDAVNLLKSAIVYSDRVTTVSETYAKEIQTAEFAHGLDGILRSEAQKVHGIVNGIDMSVSPENDPRIFEPYTYRKLSGKKKNKDAAREMFGLSTDAETPLIVMVTRLVSHKGIDLVCAALDELMQRDVQLIILGSGDWHYEQFLLDKARWYPGKLAVNIGFHPDLAQKLYAAADLFLMPSKSEPCGLAQMIAMHYGTIPIVRATGGLADTVIPYNAETGEGLGFSFVDYTSQELLRVIDAACEQKKDKTAWRALVARCMKADFSWTRSAEKYNELYCSLL